MSLRAIQEEPHFCFLACLQTFLAEQGVFLSQREILSRAPDIFGANPNDLGGFAAENFGRIEEEFGLKASVLEQGAIIVTPKESIFVLCHWEGRADQPHWVRLLSVDARHVYFMDPHPTCTEHPRKVEVQKFAEWWKRLYRVRWLGDPPGE